MKGINMKLSELIKKINKENTPPDGWKEEDKVSNVDLKGTVFCKAKKCSNHLYKYESDSLPGYCQECG